MDMLEMSEVMDVIEMMELMEVKVRRWGQGSSCLKWKS